MSLKAEVKIEALEKALAENDEYVKEMEQRLARAMELV